MTRDEIAAYLKLGASRSVTVDVRIVFGGVRAVRIRCGNEVSVEFDSWGYDEGGAYFRNQYRDLPAAVSALEVYLGDPIENWHNFSKSGKYPEQPSEASSWVEALVSGLLKLPDGDYNPISSLARQISAGLGEGAK